MADYWQERRFQLLEQMEADEARLNERLAKVYESQESLLKREIAAYYSEYGEDKVIEYRNLLASLSDDDRRLLMERMDDFAKKYPQYAHLMPVRESIYRLDRLEGLQYSIWLQQMEIGAIEQDELTAHFQAYAQKSANIAAEELGFGSNFYAINSAVITATVGAAWSQGVNFSQRIWGNREKLASYLNDDLAKGFARGLKYEDMAKMLMERFDNVSKRDAMRLIYTEGTFIFNEAQAQVHEQQFDYYQLSTITDPRTCEVCKGVERAQQAEPMAFKDRKPGVNFPPLHPQCRCSFTVYVPDWDAWIEEQVAKEGGDYIQERDRPDLNYLHPNNSEAVRDPLRTTKDASGVAHLGLRHVYDKDLFERALDEARKSNKNGGSVDWHPAAEMVSWDTLLSIDKMAGVAVKQDGDITCVFKNSNSHVRGAVTDLILTARENGGVKMDCYGRFLVNSYEKCGYEVVARVPFDPQYVDDPVLLRDRPDVYFLKKENKSTEEVVKAIREKTYHQSTQEELDALPTFDYEKAWEYRDSLI